MEVQGVDPIQRTSKTAKMSGRAFVEPHALLPFAFRIKQLPWAWKLGLRICDPRNATYRATATISVVVCDRSQVTRRTHPPPSTRSGPSLLFMPPMLSLPLSKFATRLPSRSRSDPRFTRKRRICCFNSACKFAPITPLTVVKYESQSGRAGASARSDPSRASGPFSGSAEEMSDP